MIRKLVLFLLVLLCSLNLIFAEAEDDSQNTRLITIEEFLKTAVINDTVFEQILISELPLKYKKNLNLPAKDLVLSVREQYEFYPDIEKNEPQTAVSLSKLFPGIGTDISAEYKTSYLSSPDSRNSEFSFLVSQPIARNAFGRATRLYDKIIGTEIDVIKHQIVEAYEDYLSAVITAYYSWYSAYENLKIGESSYRQNLKLLDNIKKRQRSKIAISIDVNKVNVQILTKKEKLITLQQKYENLLNAIRQMLRHDGKDILEPSNPFDYNDREITFNEDYEKFVNVSRTYKILNLLEEKSSLEVKKDADALLPSTNLLLGYTIEGEDRGLKNAESMSYTGISVTWPFFSQNERAEYKISKIEHRKTRLSNKNKYIQLKTDLRNLFNQIEREKKLISIAEEKIKLAESILKDETKNYSYGKVSLNDFIYAVNRVDENKFNLILYLVQLKILETEWFRFTDQLISRKDIKKISN